MNIYILKNLTDRIYDCNRGFCIAAENEEDARKLANTDVVCEGLIWEDSDKTSIRHIGVSNTIKVAEILLVDFISM